MSLPIDLEKNAQVSEKQLQSSPSETSFDNNGLQQGEVLKPNGFLARINNMAASLNAETRGIERIPEEEQTDASIYNAASMWFGSNMVVATVSIGVLGITVFGLDFWTATLTIIFFNILGTQSIGFFSLFGPKFGLRQMVLSRYWFGMYTVKIPIFINLVSCVGWLAVNTMVSAQLLHTINGGSLPPWAGCLILSILTLAVTFMGYHFVHTFEKYAWIPNLIIFVIMAVRMHKSHTFTAGTMTSGATTAGNVLSFGGTIYGYATGWTAIASDYTSYKPKTTKSWQIYTAVIGGLNFPLMFAMILGAAIATGTLTNADWEASYNTNSIGGLFYEVLVHDSLHGFGQFCIVLLALSTIGNNVPNLYSLGLSAQTFWEQFNKIPRVLWTFLGTGISLAIAIPAYYEFDSVMQDFMDLIGYWLAIYTAIGISEHFIYKRGFANYDPDVIYDAKLLPPGFAAFFAFFCGAVGVAVGMSQVWWTGELGRKIGAYGGDIGFELGFGFSLIAYNATRPFEKRYFKR